MSHWAEQYIGAPWENGAQGPESFDCWGFVRHVYRAQRGIDLPILAIDADKPLAVRHAIINEQAEGRWLMVAGLLHDFDVVLLSKAQHPDHVGVWIDGALLHCIREAGVIYQTRQALKTSGWNVVSCYRMAA